MSYIIRFDKWNDWYVEYKNLTLDKLCSDDEAIVETKAFEYWFNNTNNKDCDKLDKVEDFKQSNTFLELQNSYTPIYNYVHILGSFVNDNEVEMVSKYIGNVVIVHLNDADVDVIALTSCGMDFSDSIELAYYIIDGKSPVIAEQVLSLNEDAEKLLNFCRRRAKNGDVSMRDIERFIDSGYQLEEEK